MLSAMRILKSQSRAGRLRPILTTVVVIVLLSVGWVGLELYYAKTSKPAIQENYGAEIREMAEAWQPGEGPNGWDALVRACQTHKEHVESYYDEKADWSGRPDASFYEVLISPEFTREFYLGLSHAETDEEADRLMDVTAEWALETIGMFDELGITEDLDRLVAADVFIVDWPDSSLGSGMMPYQEMMSLARALSRGIRAKMELDRNRGDWDEYLRSYSHGLAVGRALRYQPGMLGSLTGIAIQHLVSSAVQVELVNQRIPAEYASRIPDVELKLRNGAPKDAVYESDQLVFLNGIQEMFDQNGRVMVTSMMGIRLLLEEPHHWTNNLKAIAMPRWRTVRRGYEERYAELGRIAMMPPSKRPEIKSKEGSGNIPIYDDTLPVMDRFLEMISIRTFLISFDHLELLEPGHDLLVAIELYRFEHGEPPGTLAELVPDYIDEVPIDWFAPNGELWNYKRLDQPDEFGRTYILYGVGRDGIDNGGAHHETSASNALEPKNSGTDYVMNHPSLYGDEE